MINEMIMIRYLKVSGGLGTAINGQQEEVSDERSTDSAQCADSAPHSSSSAPGVSYTKHQAPRSTKHQEAPNTKHQAPSTKHQAPNTMHIAHRHACNAQCTKHMNNTK